MAAGTDNATPAAALDFSNLSSIKLPGGVIFTTSGVTGLPSGSGPVYTAAGVAVTPHTVTGTVVIAGSTSVSYLTSGNVTLTGAAVFSTLSSYQFTNFAINGAQTTALAASLAYITRILATQISGSSFTITVDLNAFINLNGFNIAIDFTATGY